MAEQKYTNKYAVYVAIGRVLAMLCGFVVPIYLTRFLTKHDYGLYSQFFTLENFLGTILVLGIPTCLYYYYPKFVGKRKSLFLNNLTLLICTALLGIVIVNIPFVGNRLFKNEELFAYVHIISIYLFFFLPNKLVEPLFVVRKNKIISIIVPPVEATSRLLCVIISSQIWGTLESIFFSLVAFQILLFVFTLIYMFGCEPREERARLSGSLMKEQLSYSLPFGFAVILNTVCAYLDKIICIGSLTIEEYAIYGMAFFSIPGIKQIYDSISLVNLSNMSEAHHSGNEQMIVPLYNDFVRQVMSFTIPTVLSVCLFADDIIGFLYTEKYLASTPFFRLNLITVLFTYLGAGTVLRATGNTKYTFKANLYAALVYVPLAFVIIKIYGIWGAIIAAIIGNLLPRLFKILFELRVMKARFIDFIPLRKIGTMLFYAIICLVPLALIKHFYSPNIWICLVLIIIYLGVVFFIEIKNNLFILDSGFLKKHISRLSARFKRKGRA